MEYVDSKINKMVFEKEKHVFLRIFCYEIYDDYKRIMYFCSNEAFSLEVKNIDCYRRGASRIERSE